VWRNGIKVKIVYNIFIEVESCGEFDTPAFLLTGREDELG
jgi:hypothetical protein